MRATDGFANNRGSPRGLIRYGGTGTATPMTISCMGLPADSAQLRHRHCVRRWTSTTGSTVISCRTNASHSELTLNLGLRYESSLRSSKPTTSWRISTRRMSLRTATKGRFVIPSKNTLTLLDPRIQTYGYVLASDIGLAASLVHTDYGKLAPRLGIAWRVNDKTVLRGGYGFFFPTSAAQGMRDAMATNPFNQTRTTTASAAAPLSALAERQRAWLQSVDGRRRQPSGRHACLQHHTLRH